MGHAGHELEDFHYHTAFDTLAKTVYQPAGPVNVASTPTAFQHTPGPRRVRRTRDGGAQRHNVRLIRSPTECVAHPRAIACADTRSRPRHVHGRSTHAAAVGPSSDRSVRGHGLLQLSQY